MNFSLAKQSLASLAQRQLAIYFNNLEKQQIAQEKSIAFFTGFDDNGRAIARKLNGDLIYAPQPRIITGGGIKKGAAISAWRPEGSILGFIDGMQRGRK